MTRKKEIIKDIISITVLIVTWLFIFGITPKTISEKIKHHNHVRTARQNAYNYLNNKYGFEKNQIELSESSSSLFGFDDITDKGTFDVRGAESDFKVTVFCTENNDVGWDTYQYDEICSALSEMIYSDIPDENIALTNLSISSYFEEKNLDFNVFLKAVSPYFDGNNLDDIIKELHIEAEFSVPENSYSDSVFFKSLDDLGIEYKITSAQNIE